MPLPTITLPVTGAVLPASLADVTVKPTGEMATSDGVAFTAELRRGKRLAGTIEQEGRGGGTWFRPGSNEDRLWFDGVVAEFTYVLQERGEQPWAAAEQLLNDLYEEVALVRDLNRRRNVVFRKADDPDAIYSFQKAPASDPEVVARCKAQLARTDPTAEVWNKATSRWEKVSA